MRGAGIRASQAASQGKVAGWLAVLLLAALWGPGARAQVGLGALLDPEAAGLVAPRHPGKPDPRWTAFDWKFTDVPIPASRMRLYFYEGERWTAEYAVPEVRREIEELTRKFNGYTPTKTFSYLLFNSHRNFQQTNLFNISEGVQGVTSTSEPVMAIPYWGQAETFRHISTHEMTHQFQVQKIGDLSKGYGMETEAQIPLWFIEGMAEHYSLEGMDAQSRHYLRDLMVYPDKDKDIVAPKIFDPGAMSFLGIYKIGQAKIDFFEKTYGAGTAQKLLEGSAAELATTGAGFPGVAVKALDRTAEAIQADWEKYLRDTYEREARGLRQDLTTFTEIPGIGEAFDAYELSPDGRVLVTRELDPELGVTRLYLIDPEHASRRQQIAEDNRPGTQSLQFMQSSILAVGNRRLAFVALTISGAEVELREIERDADGGLRTRNERRVKLHEYGIREAHSLAMSPDETKIAFVGLDDSGREDVYWFDVDHGKPKGFERLTHDPYSYRDLSWGRDGILAASDRGSGEGRQYGIYRLDPASRQIRMVALGKADELAPEGSADGGVVFQSWTSGSSQIHELGRDGGETRLTEVKTAAQHPRLRGERLYFVGYRGGRYRLYRAERAQLLKEPVSPASRLPHVLPWSPMLENLGPGRVESYHPFRFKNLRIDQLGGFLGSGGVIGLSLDVSDLMRDYGLSTQIVSLGSAGQSDSHVILSSRRARVDWLTGVYYTSLPRFENVSDTEEGSNNLYLHREFGVLGGMVYPLGAFDYVNFNLGVGRLSRRNYEVPEFGIVYTVLNPGSEWVLNPTLRIGRDRVRYEMFTGPISGYAAMVESDLNVFPDRGRAARRFRLDLSYYQKFFGPSVFAIETVAGVSQGDSSESFFVSSDDLLRAYPFGDPRLIGRRVLAGRAELRFPFGTLFKFPYLRGLVGYDLGTVYNRPSDFSSRITQAYSAGLMFNFPPLSLGFVWTRPLRVAPGPKDATLFHFTLRYLYF